MRIQEGGERRCMPGSCLKVGDTEHDDQFVAPAHRLRALRAKLTGSADKRTVNQLSVQDLASIRQKDNNVTVISIANPLQYPNRTRTMHAPGGSFTEEPPSMHPGGNELYTGYLDHRATVTIKEGEEIMSAPAYLQEFEITRRGTMTGSSRREWCRKFSMQEIAAGTAAAPQMIAKKIKRALLIVLSWHRMLGLRHFLFAIALAMYAVAGMFIFFAIEGPYERQSVMDTRKSLNEAIDNLANDLQTASANPNANLSQFIKEAYLTLIKIDGKYTGSTFYKLEERDYPLWTWTHGTAFFFSFTLYSTIGYGSISPSTDWGRVAVIIYTALGFPFALVIVRDIGSVAMVRITRIYAKLVMFARRVRGKLDSTPNEEFILPMKLAFLLSLIITLLTAVFVLVYDALLGPEPGLGYFHSLYFTFLSYAAVGLGDIMLVNYAHSPLVAVVLISGMAPMRVISRVMYVGIERRMYYLVGFVEDSIDLITGEKERRTSITDSTTTSSVADAEKGDNSSTREDNRSGRQ